MAEAAEAYPGRFIGYVTINPNYPAIEIKEELDYWLGNHPWMRAIKLHPAYHDYPINGSAYVPAFEAARRYRAPVLIHTWGVGQEAALCGPEMIIDIANAYPDVPFILGHSGGLLRGYRAAVNSALRCRNIFLETCGSFQAMGLVEHLVERVGSQRVLFGSDVCFLALTAELGRVTFAKLSTADKRNILGLNAARLFGWRNLEGIDQVTQP